jgi:Tetracyclin repressor-like, C-terminal domain
MVYRRTARALTLPHHRLGQPKWGAGLANERAAALIVFLVVEAPNLNVSTLSRVASGEFHTPDIGGAALCVLTAMLRFIHPQFIAEFADKPTATLDQMIDFVIAGLSAPAK